MKPSDFAPLPEKVPAGWKSGSQWAQQWKLSIPQTCRIIRRGVKSKGIKRRIFRIRTGGAVRPVPHYAPARSRSS
jgi:hypothetical protein